MQYLSYQEQAKRKALCNEEPLSFFHSQLK